MAYSGIGQPVVQRYMSVPTLKDAQKTVYIYISGLVVFVSVCCYTGILAYDAYADCDPKTAGLIGADDQIFPLYVMQTLGNIPGIPGLFIAGVCGAALSTLSVVYNSTSLVLYSDIIKKFFKKPPSEKAATLWIKGSMLVLGLISIGGVYVIEKLDGVIATVNALTSLGHSGTLGLFMLGMLVPWSDNIGAIFGTVVAISFTGWMSFGAQATVAAGKLASQRLPMRWDGCPAEFGNLTDLYPEVDESGVFPLYRVTFWWYYPIGVLTNLLIASTVSYFTNRTKLSDLDPQLISPVIRRFLPKECFNNYGLAAKKTRNNENL